MDLLARPVDYASRHRTFAGDALRLGGIRRPTAVALVTAAILVLLGVGMVVSGVTIVFWPAGLVLAGVLVCAAGLFGVESGE